MREVEAEGTPPVMQIVVPWWLVWIIAPPVIAMHFAGIISTDTAARMVAWGVRVEAIRAD